MDVVVVTGPRIIFFLRLFTWLLFLEYEIIFTYWQSPYSVRWISYGYASDRHKKKAANNLKIGFVFSFTLMLSLEISKLLEKKHTQYILYISELFSLGCSRGIGLGLAKGISIISNLC